MRGHLLMKSHRKESLDKNETFAGDYLHHRRCGRGQKNEDLNSLILNIHEEKITVFNHVILKQFMQN